MIATFGMSNKGNGGNLVVTMVRVCKRVRIVVSNNQFAYPTGTASTHLVGHDWGSMCQRIVAHYSATKKRKNKIPFT